MPRERDRGGAWDYARGAAFAFVPVGCALDLAGAVLLWFDIHVTDEILVLICVVGPLLNVIGVGLCILVDWVGPPS